MRLLLPLACFTLCCNCTAASGALGLRAADIGAHLGGFADDYPDAHDELHRRIEELETTHPDAELGWEEWAAILGSIGAAGLGLNTMRNRKYYRPLGGPA